MNICLIIYIFLTIYYINKKNNNNSNSPNQNNTNPTNSTCYTNNINSIIISQITDNYLLYLNKLVITEKRLNHLFDGKNTIKDNYNNLFQL